MNFHDYENKFDSTAEYDLWVKEESVIYEHFRIDALKATGLTDHPKATEAYTMAWNNGHQGGLSEVFFHLQGLAELLRE